MSKYGHRLAFLIVESEPGQGPSTHKLLIASTKHNVLTAYSFQEGIQMFKRFPSPDAVLVDSELHGNERFARWVNEQNPRIRVVCLSPREAAEAFWADQTISSHDPSGLLKLWKRWVAALTSNTGFNARAQRDAGVLRSGRIRSEEHGAMFLMRGDPLALSR